MKYIRTCPVCQTTFEIAPSQKQRCCSLKCREIYRRQNHVPKPKPVYVPKTKTCITCGVTFIAKCSQKWCDNCREAGRRETTIRRYKTEQYIEAHRRFARDWQKRNPEKGLASRLARYYPELLSIIYECPCETNGNKKHHHHFDYTRPYEVLKLCDRCHIAEHKRLRRLTPILACAPGKD